MIINEKLIAVLLFYIVWIASSRYALLAMTTVGFMDLADKLRDDMKNKPRYDKKEETVG